MGSAAVYTNPAHSSRLEKSNAGGQAETTARLDKIYTAIYEGAKSSLRAESDGPAVGQTKITVANRRFMYIFINEYTRYGTILSGEQFVPLLVQEVQDYLP